MHGLFSQVDSCIDTRTEPEVARKSVNMDVVGDRKLIYVVISISIHLSEKHRVTEILCRLNTFSLFLKLVAYESMA